MPAGMPLEAAATVPTGCGSALRATAWGSLAVETQGLLHRCGTCHREIDRAHLGEAGVLDDPYGLAGLGVCGQRAALVVLTALLVQRPIEIRCELGGLVHVALLCNGQ